MTKSLLLASLLAIALTACSKKEEAPAVEVVVPAAPAADVVVVPAAPATDVVIVPAAPADATPAAEVVPAPEVTPAEPAK